MKEEESSFKHQTFDFWDLGVKEKRLKSMRENTKSHSDSYFRTLLESYLESHLESILESNSPSCL